MKYKILGFAYRYLIRPLLFRLEAEVAHERMFSLGMRLGKNKLLTHAMQNIFSYKDSRLHQSLNTIELSNPTGLAAGLDYEGKAAGIMESIGFGFHTVGTVTARPYQGNQPPRLTRLINSQAILVNKGFKSIGAKEVAKHLDSLSLTSSLGLSIGASNIEEVNTNTKQIDDYLASFEIFKKKTYIKYFELNISCPNTKMKEIFSDHTGLDGLLGALNKLKIPKPIWIKMPNTDQSIIDRIIMQCLDHGYKTFILSNLEKDRSLITDPHDQALIRDLPGKISGKPTQRSSDALLRQSYRTFKTEAVFIGCGGIFSGEDALRKLRLGASAVQVATGLIYQGPQLIGEINRTVANYLTERHVSHVSEIVGIDTQ